MNQQAEALKARAAAFAAAVVKLCRDLDEGDVSITITRQLTAAATSTAANYRAACCARSRREFVAKMAVTREQADEALGWLRFLAEIGAVEKEDVELLVKEADELTAIFTASYITAKRKLKEQHPRR